MQHGRGRHPLPLVHQIGVEHPVGKGALDLMGGPYRERGLSAARHTGHRDDRRARAAELEQGLGDPGERLLVADEILDSVRQLMRHRPTGQRLGRPGRRFCRGAPGGCFRQSFPCQYPLVHPDQLGFGIDAVLLGQRPADPVEDRECLVLPSRVAQGLHQQAVRPLPQRMCRGQHHEVRDGERGPAERQPDVAAFLAQSRGQLGEPGPLAGGEVTGDAVERLAVPAAERHLQQGVGLFEAPARAGLGGRGGEPLDLLHVRQGPGERQPVTVPPGHQGVPSDTGGLEETAPLPGVGADGGHRGVRRLVAPDAVDQFGQRRGPSGLEQQDGEERLRLRGADVPHRAVDAYVNGPEQIETQFLRRAGGRR